MADVLAIRNATQAYSSALRAADEASKKGWKVPASYTEAPWVKFLVPMTRKTVFRAGASGSPIASNWPPAVQWDELQERRNPNYRAVIEGSADVLDGGLEALTDEATGREENRLRRL